MSGNQTLLKQFLEYFGGTPHGVRAFHAPGRVNLIGEHTDYNGGYVFPAALTTGTTLLIRPRDDRQLRFASTNFNLHGSADLDSLRPEPADEWMNYPKAMAFHLALHGHSLRGADMLFSGTIPNGAGLSSSASIEVVTGYGLLAISSAESIDTVQLALIAQEAENRFVGVNCGIMDQFAVANGKQHHALLLMCDTLEYKHVPFNSGEYTIIIGNTNKRRGLVESAYNERRSQCEQAVAILRAVYPALRQLGELTPEQYEAQEQRIEDRVIAKRARHVVEENYRVLQSMKALHAEDLPAFGRLMTDSHRSLQHLYEVTGPELDAMVDAALQVDGVLGSRMTGAGFGGCTVSLVHTQSVNSFIDMVSKRYTQFTGLTPAFYSCDIGDGVKEVDL